MLLDVAPFAYVVEENGYQVFRWEEPRDIQEVRLRVPTGYRDDPSVEYWQRAWPGSRQREEDLAPGRIGRAAWKPQDDWYNGDWRFATLGVKREEEEVIISFAPLTREFPELDDYAVGFRRTMKLRIRIPEGGEVLGIYTDTPLEGMELHLDLACEMETPQPKAEIEVYNGFLEELGESPDGDRLLVRLQVSRPGSFSNDATVVTIRSETSSFSFRPDDLSPGRPILIPDLHALVSLAADDLHFEPGGIPRVKLGMSIHDRVLAEPEQSLKRAMDENPPKRPMHFVVGVEGRRQKFGVEPNGDIFAGIGFVRRVPASDTGKVSWEGRRLYLRLHYDGMALNGRFLQDGYLPILRSTYSRGSLDVEQEVLATLLHGDHAGPIRGDDPVVALVHITYVNRGDTDLEFRQAISTECGRPMRQEHLILEDGVVRAGPEGGAIRLSITTGDAGSLDVEDAGVAYSVGLGAGERHSILLAMPFIDSLTKEEIGSLTAKDWGRERHAVVEYWRDRIGGGTDIHTGVQDIDDFHRALLTHILINDDHEVGSERIIGRVSSFNYGNFPNESIMQIMELDRRGFHDEARRHLETYLYYQGTKPLPGNFSSTEGLFYGSGGYECGDYNQHHGWVLFGMAMHYRLTGDVEWLRSVSEGLVAGCDWVARERRSTMHEDAQGRRVLEYGWLPAGSLEDVREFCYWVSTNALTYRGLVAVAEALGEVGHPDGERLGEEARSYREDLLASIREAMVRSPVVRLRDGTYVPHVPSRLYWRGRDVGWIREVLEGSIIAVTTLLDAGDPISEWIMRDFEDNRYLGYPWNYELDDYESQWFSRGGFSMQPNLVYIVSPYLSLDMTAHFLRMFFNSFAACWRPEIRAMTEHPLPTLADWTGDHFKSSDESMSAYHLRLMFIQEVEGELRLGWALPRRWLTPGSHVWIRNAHTEYGRMSLEIRVSPDGQRMVARIDPPRRASPKRTVLRLRQSLGRDLTKVRLDGKIWKDFEGDKVLLPRADSEIELVAFFRE